MRKHARVLQPLQEGDSVFVKRFQVDGKVLQEADRPRSYIVDTPRGVISRNRRHLVKLNRDVQLNEPTDLPTGVENSKQPDCNGTNFQTLPANRESDTPSSQPLEIIQNMQNDKENLTSDKHYVGKKTFTVILIVKTLKRGCCILD